jgi:hypothetical protein
MSRKILFFLSTDSFHAHVWKNGVLAEPYYFSNSVEGLERFAEFLISHRYPSYLLVDMIEEDFRQETVPHLTGTNYQALVQRKFDQYYRSTPFRLSMLQQRQTEGRRDDELLFSALTNPSRITAWLELLLQYKMPIVGIYSLPHASAPLIKDIESDHLLLLSWEKDAGLRQSYFLNKKLRFSRLTPIKANSSFADVIVEESARTHQYLKSLSLTPQGQVLNVHIICHANDKTQLDAKLTGKADVTFSYLDLQLLGQKIKSKYVFPDSNASPLFLHLLATHPPRANYATSDHTHYYQLWQTQRGLFGLAAVTALACIVWSTLSFIEGSGLSEEIEGYSFQANRMVRETQQIIQTFPVADGHSASASDMKTAVTLFRNLQNLTVAPEQILKGLSTTLDNFPRIQTSKLEWQMNQDSSIPEQTITFNGELANFGNDYRGALDYLESFQMMLTKSGYTVNPIKLPLDFSTKGSISADIGDNSSKPSEFSLKLIWRQQP